MGLSGQGFYWRSASMTVRWDLVGLTFDIGEGDVVVGQVLAEFFDFILLFLDLDLLCSLFFR